LSEGNVQPIETESIRLPVHVAIIMDGNGRWAAKRGLPRFAGHQAGTENLRRIIRACVELKVQYLTLYAFSTENWGRPKEEIDGLMHILADVIDRDLDELNQEGVQLRHLGHLEALPASLREKVLAAVKLTENNQRMVLCLAFNYGGRDEIVCALRKIIAEGIPMDEVTPEVESSTCLPPDPDRIDHPHFWRDAYE
jgi:undecaprenyl diphosphate synthase